MNVCETSFISRHVELSLTQAVLVRLKTFLITAKNKVKARVLCNVDVYLLLKSCVSFALGFTRKLIFTRELTV